MCFTGINYYKLYIAVEKDCDSIFTTTWKSGFTTSTSDFQSSDPEGNP